MRFITALGAFASTALAGTILWDGRVNDLTSSADLDKWSFSNEVGPYQWYIHGSAATSKYVNFDPTFKNPADTGSSKGIKMSIDQTSYWNGQNMRRSELIPQTTAAINKGKVFYHFSIKRSDTNPPLFNLEHQINFFESHFTELKTGLNSGASGTTDNTLRWLVGGVAQWSTVFTADVWHNVAYEIDFSANTVGFWHSTGSDALTQVIKPVSASTSSNGADWHLGVLRLPGSSSLTNPDTEDYYFSGVYIESGSITTSVSGPGAPAGSAPAPSSVTPATTSSAAPPPPASTTFTTTTRQAVPTPATTTTTKVVTTTAAATTAPAAGGSLAKYAQCGGANWTGSGSCVSGTKCTKANDYYSQCL